MDRRSRADEPARGDAEDPQAGGYASAALTDAWLWMRGADGLAAAQWAAAVLAVIAIVIGLVLALIEQRRANAEKLREQSREREALERQQEIDKERHRELHSVVILLLHNAYVVMTEDLPDERSMSVRWTIDDGKPLELATVKMALTSITPSATGEVQLLLDITKAISIIEGVVDTPLLRGFATGSLVLSVLRRQASALKFILDDVSERAQRAFCEPRS